MIHPTEINPRQSTCGDSVASALRWILQKDLFNSIRAHGNTTWSALDLVSLAVFWVWSDSPCLTTAFAHAKHYCCTMLGSITIGTYQAFTNALVRWTASLLPLLFRRLHTLMQHSGDRYWRVGPWLALAVDGTRISTPRTEANEKEFCCKTYGQSSTAKSRKKKKAKTKRSKARSKAQPQPVKPQIWLTMLWHLGMRLPWCWKSGPSYASERDHFKEMLQEHSFPEKTLFCGDAGFTGYELWSTMVQQGHHFVIRVGSNVTLLRKLGYVREGAGLVYLWPDKASKKHQPPLVLRLWQFQLSGTRIYLVSSVLEEEELSAAQVKELYQLRWGIEVSQSHCISSGRLYQPLRRGTGFHTSSATTGRAMSIPAASSLTSRRTQRARRFLMSASVPPRAKQHRRLPGYQLLGHNCLHGNANN